MATLRDLMTAEVVTVDADISLQEAAELLATDHITGVPVVERGRVVGVVSATDLLEFAADAPGAPRSRDEPDEWDARLTAEEEAPVVYFSGLWEDAGADVLERFRNSDSPEWNVLAEHQVSEVMTRAVYSLDAGTDVREAARFLLEHAIHRVLVTEEGTLVGLVTTTDIVRGVAEGRL